MFHPIPKRMLDGLSFAGKRLGDRVSAGEKNEALFHLSRWMKTPVWPLAATLLATADLKDTKALLEELS